MRASKWLTVYCGWVRFFLRLSIDVWVLLSGNRLIGWLTDFEFDSRTKELCACVPEFKVNNKLILLFFSCSLWFRCHFEKFSFAVCVSVFVSFGAAVVLPGFTQPGLIWFDETMQKLARTNIQWRWLFGVLYMLFVQASADEREEKQKKKQTTRSTCIFTMGPQSI